MLKGKQKEVDTKHLSECIGTEWKKGLEMTQ